MRVLFEKNNIINFLLLPVFAIGGFYDRRLAIGDFNLTYLFSALFIITLIISFNKKGNKIVRGHLFFLFVLSFIVTLINWLIWGFNDFDDYSINKLIVLSLITFPVCFYITTFKSENDVKIFLQQISLIGLLLGLLGFVQIISGGGGGESRLAVFGGGPIVFSRWVGLFFIIFLYNFSVKKVFKIIALSICIILMLFSGSKGPFFFLLLTLFLLHVKNKNIIIFVATLYFLVKLNSSFILTYLSKYPMLVRIFGLDETSSITEGTSSSARVSLINESLVSIYDNPLGYGLGNFSRYSDTSGVLGPTGYPHNFFIETWLESGFIVLLIVVVYFCILLTNVFKSLYFKGFPLTQTKKSMIAVWIFYFLNSLVSGDLSDARFLIVFTVLYFVLNNIIKKNKHENCIYPSIF